MARPITKLLTGLAVAVIAVLGVIFIVLLRPKPAPAPLPNPNGYEGLLQASKMLERDTDFTTMNEERLRTALAKNAEALNTARKALTQESRVKLDYSATNSSRLEEISGIKRLAQVFVAQGRLAEIDHHPREAAYAYLDAIRLGLQSERGGTIIDSMVGIAVEALGASALEKLSSQLTTEECREIGAALEIAERGRQPIEALLAQERAWARRTYGFKAVLIRLMTFKQLRAGEQRWAAKRRAQEIRTQQLLTKLATKAHELEKGESQKSAGDSVPR